MIENLAAHLSKTELEEVVQCTLASCKNLDKVLVIHNDYSRNDFTHLLFPSIYEALKHKGVSRLDTLNAGGTHRMMSDDEIRIKLGISGLDLPCLGEHYNHVFDNPWNLFTAGTIPAEFIAERTEGLLKQPLKVTANRLLLEDYDLIIAINGTVPHEALGFSGGLKMFFPGISGPELIGLLHWAAVLMGIPELIGRLDNPAREVVTEGSKFIFDEVGDEKIISFNMLYGETNHNVIPKGLYTGTGLEGFISAHRQASEGSSKIHIVKLDAPLQQAVQEIPQMYDEVWTAGKGSYKLQKTDVMKKGGEIILYAPHIRRFHSNPVMNKAIKDIGYHGREWVINYLKENPGFDKNVASHVINVRGPGTLTGNEEFFDFKVTLASAVSEKECLAAGLGYRDPESLRKEDFNSPEKLWIEDGGKWLYSR